MTILTLKANKNILPGEWFNESEEASDREWREAALLALRVTGRSRTGGCRSKKKSCLFTGIHSTEPCWALSGNHTDHRGSHLQINENLYKNRLTIIWTHYLSLKKERSLLRTIKFTSTGNCWLTWCHAPENPPISNMTSCPAPPIFVVEKNISSFVSCPVRLW